MRDRVVATLALAVLTAVPALAQRTTGGIVGTVRDESGAVLAGVTVAVTGPTIVGSQTATTGTEGFYRITNLPPGVYDVSYTMSGFRTLTRKGLRVSLGLTAEENVALAVSQRAEEVTVTAEAPVVDTQSNEVGANYDRTVVENLPTRRFSFFDLVAAAPGGLQAEDGSSRTMVYGSGYDENSFQLDGVDITDNYFNEWGAQPNIDAIEEVEVLSLGAPAEYGNLTGAVYNIVTRQGSNQFHGDVNFFLQTDGLTGNNSDGLTNPDGSFVNACGDARCPWTRDSYHDFTAQLGGPLIKDKLWFFASYQRQLDSYWDVGVDPTIAGGAKKSVIDRYLGKLTWQINPKHKLVGTFHLDDGTDDNGLDIGFAPSTAWTRWGKTPTPGIGYTGVLSDKTVVDVRYSGFYGDVRGGPTDPDQPRDLPRFYDLDTTFISGGHYYWYDVDVDRTTATAKISHLAENFLGGSHDFRFGVQYSTAKAQGIYGYNDFVYTYMSEGVRYGYGYERQPFSYSGNSRSLGVFVDDTFRANDRVSFNLGLRYDYNKAYSAEQQELDDLANPTGRSFPETDLYTWNTISPRVGFNVKLTADGKTVLKGHWGRYHRAVATGEYANVVGPSIKATYSGLWDFGANRFDPGSLELFESNENLSVDPNYKSPYNDQFILSLERELFRNFGINANYVYKRGRQLQAWRETRGQYVTVPVVDNVGTNPTGNTIDVYRLVSDPGDRAFEITNPEGAFSDVHAVSVNLLKRMSDNWLLNSSVTWLRGTGRLQESASGVGISQRSGLQFRDFGKNPNDFVNTDGRLRLDVTWLFKTQLVWQLPAGFLVSGNFMHRDGAWSVRRARVTAAVTNIPEGTVIFLQKRGENERIESVTMLDARVQKDFKLGSQVKLSIFADALNLLNDDAPEAVQSSLTTSSTYNWRVDPVDPRRLMIGAKLKF